jgi:hypothetical protein
MAIPLEVAPAEISAFSVPVEPEINIDDEVALSFIDRAKGRLYQAGISMGNLAAMGAVGLELNHATNEGSRAYVLATVQEASHNTPLATAACVAATAVVEGAGALGAARLLDTKYAHWLTDRIGGKPKDMSGESRRTTWKTKATNGAIDSTLAITLGSPATVVARQLRNPTRTKAENVRTGLLASAGVSAATAPVGWFLASPAEGVVSHLGEGNTTMLTAGIVGVAGLMGYVRKRMNDRKHKEISNNDKEII